jgi:hypothetical protein
MYTVVWDANILSMDHLERQGSDEKTIMRQAAVDTWSSVELRNDVLVTWHLASDADQYFKPLYVY